MYWCAGGPPLGGEWKGRDAVIRSMNNREQGLGAADWGYEDVWRAWYEADERVIVEIQGAQLAEERPSGRDGPANLRRAEVHEESRSAR